MVHQTHLSAVGNPQAPKTGLFDPPEDGRGAESTKATVAQRAKETRRMLKYSLLFFKEIRK